MSRVTLKTPTAGMVKCESGQWVPYTSFMLEKFDCMDDAVEMIRLRSTPNCIIEEDYQ